jgi:GNAT superfamily N-acetyltransferase
MTGLIGELTRWLGHRDIDAGGRLTTRHVATTGIAIEIRVGMPSDVGGVVPMIARSCALHREWDTAKFGFVDEVVPMYREWLVQRVTDPCSVFVVAAIEARLVAFAIATIERAPPIVLPEAYGFIRDFWIEEECRRVGIGRQMLRLTMDRFHALGITQIRLETATANEAARHFFASCGFRPSATEMLIE